jgi:hypothetical protein
VFGLVFSAKRTGPMHLFFYEGVLTSGN